MRIRQYKRALEEMLSKIRLELSAIEKDSLEFEPASGTPDGCHSILKHYYLLEGFIEGNLDWVEIKK